MLTRDSSPYDAWGHEIDFENSECEECGRSTIGRFGRQPFAQCDSCQSDEDRIFTDPNTRWETTEARPPFQAGPGLEWSL